MPKAMATQSKAQFLNDVHDLLKKRYKLGPGPDRLSVLEAVVYGICHEGTTREQANQALSRFKDDFFDWNEVRVSSIDEIQGVLAGLPEPEAKAHAIRRFLRQLFEKTYGFTLDALTKKPQKESLKSLEEYDAFQSDYVTSAVIRHALGGHAIPVDGPMRRALERLGVAEPDVESEALRGGLERAVPKNRGGEFTDLIEELAHDTCVAGEPDCPRCELKKICPTGQVRISQAGAKATASKPAVPARPAAPKGTKTKAPTPAPPVPEPEQAKAPKGKPGRSK